MPEKGTKGNRREYIPLAEGWGGWWFPPSLLRIFDDVWVLYYIILDFVGDVTCHLQYILENMGLKASLFYYLRVIFTYGGIQRISLNSAMSVTIE